MPRRRNSNDGRDFLQYNTERGPCPVRLVDSHVQQAYGRLKGESGYPTPYNNREKSASGQLVSNFDSRYERPRASAPGNVEYVEIPVLSGRFKLDKPSATLRQMQYANQPEPQARERVLRNPRNDPTAMRGIYATDVEDRSRCSAPLGLNYHPEGNPAGNRRAALEPLNAQGRQYMSIYQDEFPIGRLHTWPSQGRTSEVMTRYEETYDKDWKDREMKRKIKEAKQAAKEAKKLLKASKK